jgi:hypothetical protein
MHKYLPN